jgi:hypothetical protein
MRGWRIEGFSLDYISQVIKKSKRTVDENHWHATIQGLAQSVQVEDKCWTTIMLQQLFDANFTQRCVWPTIFLYFCI